MCSFRESFTSLVDSFVHKEGSSCGSLKRWVVAVKSAAHFSNMGSKHSEVSIPVQKSRFAG